MPASSITLDAPVIPFRFWCKIALPYYGGWIVNFWLSPDIELTGIVEKDQLFGYSPGLISVILIIAGFMFFAKYCFLFWNLSTGENGGGNGNGKHVWHYIWISIFIVFCVLLSYSVFLWCLKMYPKSNLFNYATLWSTVYGTILGTLSLLIPPTRERARR